MLKLYNHIIEMYLRTLRSIFESTILSVRLLRNIVQLQSWSERLSLLEIIG